MSIIEKLNAEQQKPALQTEGPVLVTAGAGSGKTRLLTHRIAHLIQDNNVSPSNILAITFTNKASNEMKERLESLLDGGIQGMWICTFHAMCCKLLRFHSERVSLSSNFSIYGDNERDRLIKRILNDDPEFAKLEKNKLKPDSVGWHISNAKNDLLSPELYARKIKNDPYVGIIIRTYIEYQKELLCANAVDFDDLLVKAYELLDQNPDLLELYQNKFKYIHVDEFQDTNVVQYELVRLLGAKYHNVFAVGDEDQCIYSWRGAKFTNVQKFIDDNPGIHIFKLEQNYRSTDKILDTANKIIKNNTNRLDKNLWTAKSGGEEVKFFTAYNDLEEAEFVASKIKKLVSDGKRKYSDFAVLMRMNSLSRVVEEKFLNYQIPYAVYGGFKFFERKEVKDTLAYLKFISNPKDNDSLLRILAFPKKGIGEATATKLLQVSSSSNLSCYELIKGGIGLDAQTLKKVYPIIMQLDKYVLNIKDFSLTSLADKVIEEFGIKTVFSRLIEEELTKILNIETLQKSILEYDEANENATLEDYLQSVTLSRDIDDLDDSNNVVSLMTIHASKGLEFNVVFIIGLVEGVLPLSRAIYSNDPNELEEERRLMYVATTRAKEELYYTRPTTKFSYETKRTEGTQLSRFLKESGVKGVETTARKEYGESSLYERSSGYSNSGYGYKANSAYDRPQTRNSYKNTTLDDIYSGSGMVEAEKPKISTSTLNEFKKYKVGTIVMHKSFGRGVVVVGVTDASSGFVTIKFDSVGNKTLSLKFAPLTIVEN